MFVIASKDQAAIFSVWSVGSISHCITILQNLRATRKFFGDRSYQKRGDSPRQVCQARKGHPALDLKQK